MSHLSRSEINIRDAAPLISGIPRRECTICKRLLWKRQGAKTCSARCRKILSRQGVR